LLVKTKTVLLELIKTAPFLQNYVLVGGSALALHLCHRQSEDLDFFTYADSFQRQDILHYLKHFKHTEVLNDNTDQLDLLIDGYTMAHQKKIRIIARAEVGIVARRIGAFAGVKDAITT